MNAPGRSLSPVARTVWRAQQGAIWGALVVAGVVLSLNLDVGGALWWLVPALGLLVCVAVVPPLLWSRWRWDIGDDGIDIQHGALTVRRTLVPWVRVQHVDTRRGIFEQTFGLSTVVVHTAAGSHTIPLLAAGDAEQLRTRIAELARTAPPGVAVESPPADAPAESPPDAPAESPPDALPAAPPAAPAASRRDAPKPHTPADSPPDAPSPPPEPDGA